MIVIWTKVDITIAVCQMINYLWSTNSLINLETGFIDILLFQSHGLAFPEFGAYFIQLQGFWEYWLDERYCAHLTTLNVEIRVLNYLRTKRYNNDDPSCLAMRWCLSPGQCQYPGPSSVPSLQRAIKLSPGHLLIMGLWRRINLGINRNIYIHRQSERMRECSL